MDAKSLRRLFHRIVTGSVPVVMLMQPGLSNESGGGLRLNGCYPIGYSCDPSGVTSKDFDNVPLSSETKFPLDYQLCLKLCNNRISQLPPTGDYAEYMTSNCTSEKAAAEGEAKIMCTYSKRCPGAGRRPHGLQSETCENDAGDVGLWFANMAHLEEAAVVAFEYLSKELQAYNAPEGLIKVAQEAADEEREHTSLTQALARRYGAAPLSVEVAPFKLRSLVEIALDNLVEGCIRETFGALSAFWQTEHAEDEAVAAVTHRIVFEESRHAALSWEIHRWLWPQLAAEEQQLCEEAGLAAIDDLERSLGDEPPADLKRIAGLPSASEALALFTQLKTALWC